MKAIKTFLLFTMFICIAHANVFASAADTTLNRDVKKFYLRINSIVHDSKGPDKADEKILKGAIVKVMNADNYLIASYFSDKKGKITFDLALDKKYKIIISKKGYVSKIIEVDSSVPKDVNNAYIFPADMYLFEEVGKLNTAVLLKPIAKVKFDKMSANFEYDRVYTNKINGELKIMYKEYYAIKKAQKE